MKGKGAVAYININGKEVKIGGVLDPRRFVMSDGKNFNAYNLQHLYELNSSFVDIINNPDGSQEPQVSAEGLNVQTYYATMLKLFEELETNNGASTDFINNLFYTNKNFPYKVLKDVPLEERPSFTATGTDACEYAWFVWDATKEPLNIVPLKKYRSESLLWVYS